MKTDDKLDLMLKLMKEQFGKIDQRFEQIDNRFEQIENRLEKIDQRFEQVEKRLDQIEYRLDNVCMDISEMKREIRRNSDRLEKVYETRHEVEYKISRDFILKNLGWNMSIIVIGLILGKLIIL